MIPPKTDKDGWPEELIIPTPEEFSHGNYTPLLLRYDTRSLRETLEYEGCGTQCCLLGWAALAFDGDASSYGRSDNKAKVAFLETFSHLVEGAPRNDVETGINRAESIFEGWPKRDSKGHEGKRKPLTPRQAHKYWKLAARKHGYDV